MGGSDNRGIAAIALASLLATGSGCYRTGHSPPDGGERRPDVPPAEVRDAPRTDEEIAFAPGPTYVVMQQSFDFVTEPYRRGFDLDGLASTASDVAGCSAADAIGGAPDAPNVPEGCTPSDAGCTGRVDNELVSLFPSLREASSLDLYNWGPARVESYDQVLLVRILGIDDYTNDEAVTALVYEAFPAFTTGCDDGRLVFDREFVLARSSLRDDARTIDDARVVIPARIVDRRITIRGAPTDAVQFGIGDVLGARFTAPLHGISMAWDFYEPEDVYGYNGNFGGWLGRTDVVDGLAATFPSERAAIDSVVTELADVSVGGACDALSMGMGIRMARARVRAEAPVVETRPPGACGAPRF